MKKQFASAITTLAVGLLVWATTTSLQLLDAPWRIGIALMVALVAGVCVYLLLRSSQEKSKQQRILSDIRAGGDANFSNIDVDGLSGTKNISVASNIKAGRNATFREVRIGKARSRGTQDSTSNVPPITENTTGNSDQ